MVRGGKKERLLRVCLIVTHLMIFDPGSWRSGLKHNQGLYLGPGQSLIPGFLLQSTSGFGLLLSELSVVSQDLGVGLQDVVENVEAERAPNLWALLQRTHLWVVKVLVSPHSSE